MSCNAGSHQDGVNNIVVAIDDAFAGVVKIVAADAVIATRTIDGLVVCDLLSMRKQTRTIVSALRLPWIRYSAEETPAKIPDVQAQCRL